VFTKEGQPIKGEFQRNGFFKKTLLDGEIVLDTMEDGSQQLKFLVFDALAVGGKVLLTRDLSKRLGVRPSCSFGTDKV
jgi:mRNA guanylyltransferase